MTTPIAATPGVDAPPLALPPRPVVLPPLAQYALTSGLQVVVASRRNTPVVTATLMVRAGPEVDPAGRAGAAALTAAVLTKGARLGGRPAGAPDIARQAEALGATLDTTSAWHASTVSMTVTTPQLPRALALMVDVLRHPLFADAEIERVRALTLDGLRVALSDPAAVAAMVVRRAAWGDAPWGRSPTPASLRRLQRADLTALHGHHCRPSRTVLVLAGDISADAGLGLAERMLADWRDPSVDRGAAPAAAPASASAAQAAGPAAAPNAAAADATVLIDMPGAGQSAVAVAAPFVGHRHPQRRIGQVANAVIGGGYSARVNQEVRIRRGLSYGAFSETQIHPDAGLMLASTQTSHAHAAEVLRLLRAEILRLAEAAPSPDELAARQATLVGSFARRLETTGGLAAIVLSQLAAGRALDELGQTVQEIMSVTPTQVQQFAREHWLPGRLSSVVAGDLASAGAALADTAPRALRVPIGQLDLESADLRAR